MQEQKRIKWTHEEDQNLINMINNSDKVKWKLISENLLILFDMKRTSQQCRDRYINHLQNNYDNIPWTKEENITVFNCFFNFGNKWKQISSYLDNKRSENNIKNHVYCIINKILRNLNKKLGNDKLKKQIICHLKSKTLSIFLNLRQISDKYEKYLNSYNYFKSICYKFIQNNNKLNLENYWDYNIKKFNNFLDDINEFNWYVLNNKITNKSNIGLTNSTVSSLEYWIFPKFNNLALSYKNGKLFGY